VVISVNRCWRSRDRKYVGKYANVSDSGIKMAFNSLKLGIKLNLVPDSPYKHLISWKSFSNPKASEKSEFFI
jgi:hypothetical protein